MMRLTVSAGESATNSASKPNSILCSSSVKLHILQAFKLDVKVESKVGLIALNEAAPETHLHFCKNGRPELALYTGATLQEKD